MRSGGCDPHEPQQGLRDRAARVLPRVHEGPRLGPRSASGTCSRGIVPRVRRRRHREARLAAATAGATVVHVAYALYPYSYSELLLRTLTQSTLTPGDSCRMRRA